MKEVLFQVAQSPFYIVAVWFLAAFPILIAALAINSSRQYLLDRKRETTQHYIPHTEELMLARRRWPLVSIVIPARNEQEFLSETINRSLILDWPELEVIVINDGSTDNTQKVIESFSADQRVKTIHHVEPRGKSTSLNEGIELAQSEIVIIMDADAVPAKKCNQSYGLTLYARRGDSSSYRKSKGHSYA